jgi:hypothetical protein
MGAIWLVAGAVVGFLLPLLIIPGTLSQIYRERGRAAAIKLWLLGSALAVPGMMLFVWVIAVFFV